MYYFFNKRVLHPLFKDIPRALKIYPPMFIAIKICKNTTGCLSLLGYSHLIKYYHGNILNLESPSTP
ncbi:hypothetical protein BXY64_2450 [Marinifilum flexuosum]|uniref:Uncharacterized protein n=1 Tax=Marinifilum flexuosum TaxID=1117708 RepID=A0A419X3S2_9BACT|nr:hypothetical protein BXY64_2450 [Marinifilum flexuosum]